MPHRSEASRADAMEMLSMADISRLMRLGQRTLWRMAAGERFPKPDLRVGARIVRWRRSTIEEWLENGGGR